MNSIVEFKDKGQNVLCWIITDAGEVIDSHPLPDWQWLGRKVSATCTRISDGQTFLIMESEDGPAAILEHAVNQRWNTKANSFSDLGAVA